MEIVPDSTKANVCSAKIPALTTFMLESVANMAFTLMGISALKKQLKKTAKSIRLATERTARSIKAQIFANLANKTVICSMANFAVNFMNSTTALANNTIWPTQETISSRFWRTAWNSPKISLVIDATALEAICCPGIRKLVAKISRSFNWKMGKKYAKT